MIGGEAARQGFAVQRDWLQRAIEASVLQPALRQATFEAMLDVLQGNGEGFAALQGTPLQPLATVMRVERDTVVVPAAAFSHAPLVSCISGAASAAVSDDRLEVPDANDSALPPDDTPAARLVSSGHARPWPAAAPNHAAHAYPHPPSTGAPSVPVALLVEMSSPLGPDELRAALEAMLSCGEAHAKLSTAVRMVVQLAQLDGPLRMLGGSPSYSDLGTFQQHLLLLMGQLNMMHDHTGLGGFMQSPLFLRSKYELFALQHVQLLTWFRQVQASLAAVPGISGHELQLFVARLAQSTRIRFFQAAVLHMAQVAGYVRSLGNEVAGSMQQALLVPSESESDGLRVEWAQLNLLIQVRELYRDALCNPAVFEGPHYSQAEARLLTGLLGLEVLSAYLIRLFPAACPLTEQEHAIYIDLCQKVLKYFSDGKQIKNVLDQNPQQGKAILVANGLAASQQYAVREWTLPFFDVLSKLLKAQWALWTQHKHKLMRRRGTEQLARLVARGALQQVQERELHLRAGSIAQQQRQEPQQARLPMEDHRQFQQPAPPHEAPPAQQQLQSQQVQEAPKPSGWASVVRKTPIELPVPPTPPKAVAVPLVKQRSTGTGSIDEQVRALVMKREQARFSRDFDAADRLREQLTKLGISIDDQSRSWRASDGRSGPILPVNVSEMHAQKALRAAGGASLADADIEKLVREREQARCTGDFKTADRLRDQLEKHGVHLGAKEGRWQAADGRSGPIAVINVSAAHAQKAARAGAPRLSEEEVQKILVQREQARARRDYKTADVLRDQLERHGIYLDSKEKKWHGSDGSSGAIIISTLSDEEVGRILGARQAARLRHDYKAADRLRDQLNEQGLSVDDKRNRWESSDGRCGTIEPFIVDPAPKGGFQPRDDPQADDASSTDASATESLSGSDSVAAAPSDPLDRKKKPPSEKERRELAKQLRAVTQSSARLCERALQLHGDDIDRAADWLLSQGDHNGAADVDDDEDESLAAGLDSGVSRFAQLIEHGGHACALAVSDIAKLSASALENFTSFFPASQRVPGGSEDSLFTPFKSPEDRHQAIAVLRRSAEGVDLVEEAISMTSHRASAHTPFPRLLVFTIRAAVGGTSSSTSSAAAGGANGGAGKPPAATTFEDAQIRAVIGHVVALTRNQQQQQADHVIEELHRHGFVLDWARQRWQLADGRSGAIEPFTLTHSMENGRAGAAALGNGVSSNGAMPMATLTDDKIKVVVDHVVGLVRAHQRPQADQIIEEVKRLGLIVDLQRLRWHSTDGRGGAIDPFSCERMNIAASSQEGGPSDSASVPMPSLSDDKVRVVIEHVVNLVRSSLQRDADQLVEEVKRLGLIVDLHRKRWHTLDGRSGALDPFTLERSANVEASNGDRSESRAARSPAVSLASVMHEQATGRDAASTAAGISNPRGEFNCFLNVVVQLLWHAREFREALADIRGDDPVLCALQDTFAGLSSSASEASDSVPPAVSVEALRVALSTTAGGARFRLGDMADAVEAFEALLERLRECGAHQAIAGFEWHTVIAGISYPQLVLYANVADMQNASAMLGTGFDDVLRHITLELPDGPKTTLSGELPALFTLGLAWETAVASKEQLSSILGCIDERIDLAKVLGSSEGEVWAEAVGLICYHASHYCAIARDDAGSWRQFDDATVTHVGETWIDVRFKCHSAKYQPALVLYRTLPAAAAELPASGAEVVGTWANMAVRCAALGGISESSRPAGSTPGGGTAPRAVAVAPRAATAARKVDAFCAPYKRGPGACHNCDDPTHESRDCPKPCRECGSDKHRIGYHYRARTMVKTSKCFNCDEFGHESRDCTKRCGICQSTQHKSGYHLNDHLYEQGKAPVGGSTPGGDKRKPQGPRGNKV